MLRITLRQLEAFHWAATLGTVNAAAKHLFVSQPAVTARINELEEILGLTLLSRSQHGVQLTPSGRELLANVQRILLLGEELEESARHDVPPLDGMLRLGADDSSATVAVAEILRQLKSRYPGLRVHVSVGVSKALHEKINRRELDVALHTSPVARPHVVDVLLGHLQVAWVAAPGLLLPAAPLTPQSAASVPIVTNPQPSILHYVARNWLGKASDLERLNTCNSLSMITRIVQDGHAIAALPVPVVQERLSAGTLKLVDADPPLAPIAYYVSYLAEKEAAGVAKIVDLAKEVLQGARFFVEGPPAA